MITANELRIGNKIYLNEEEDGLIVKDVTTLDIDTIFRAPDKDWYRPIPLTPEILKKCGFDQRPPDEDYEYWGILNFTIVRGKATDGQPYFFLNGYRNDVTILYLHQLQNLYFALTGQELKVAL